ncbi:MAG: cation:proton antiporter [archaeon]
MVTSLSLEVFISLFLCLFLVFVLQRILKKLGLPMMIAPIVVGLLIRAFQSKGTLLLPEFKIILEIFSIIGIILTLFFMGLKISFSLNMAKNSTIMALNSGLIPFILGVSVTYMFGFDLLQSLFAGICLAITAEEVSISILEELKLVRTKIGQLIMETGALGNIFELLIIALLGIMIRGKQAGSGANPFAEILFELFVFVIAVVLFRYIVIPIIFTLIGKEPRNSELFLSCFIILLMMAIISDVINFGYIIGVLVAGILIKDHLIESKDTRRQQKVIEVVETVNFSIFEPIIFILIGMSINIESLLSSPLLGLILTLCAIVGKLVGAILGNYFCKESLYEGLVIGWGLNARGATELFAVLIAKNVGIIDSHIFNAVVFMMMGTCSGFFKMIKKTSYGTIAE